MISCIILVLVIYFSFALGLYFKGQTLEADLKNMRAAFEAPLYWLFLLIFIIVKRKEKRFLKFVIQYAHVSLFLCFVTLSELSRVSHQSQREKCMNIFQAYEKDLAICAV